MNARGRYAVLISPCLQYLGTSESGYQAASTRICHLLLACRPSAIAGLIVAAIVNALYFRRWKRTLAHVFQKIGEFAPAFTYRDTSAAVMVPVLKFWVATSAINLYPCLVRARAVGSVLSCVACLPFVGFAAARFDAARFQMRGNRFFRATARAFTKPKCTLVSARDQSKYSQFAKLTPSYVFLSWSQRQKHLAVYPIVIQGQLSIA